MGLLLLLCAACSSDDGVTEEAAVVREVEVAFSPVGFGDAGYNDAILYGIQLSCKAHGFRLRMHCPRTLEEGWEVYQSWCTRPDDGTERLFVFAAPEYEQRLRQSPPSLPAGKTVLQFEADAAIPGAATFGLEMYGAAYSLGRLVSQLVTSAAVVAANSVDPSLQHWTDGFRDGLREEDAGFPLEVLYLSEQAVGGYDEAVECYRLAYSLYQQHGFVLPVAGGSNQGILQYTREHPDGIYTAGTDSDMSAYSTQVVASLVKRMDRIIEDYFARWQAEGGLEGHERYGLASDYVEVQLSERYGSFAQRLEEWKKQAIIKEEAYGKNQ